MSTLGSMVEQGNPAPDFALRDDEGTTVKLSDLRGRRVVLYFYPKDDTPGCTRQACGFRDSYRAFEDKGVTVFGISPDDEASHALFRAKFGLPYPLLADPDRVAARAYGVWREKTTDGKKTMGIHRSTFVIGPDGTIERAMLGVSPDGNAEAVLAGLPSS
jgi:peroxiredoxin Q/BCP